MGPIWVILVHLDGNWARFVVIGGSFWGHLANLELFEDSSGSFGSHRGSFERSLSQFGGHSADL